MLQWGFVLSNLALAIIVVLLKIKLVFGYAKVALRHFGALNLAISDYIR